MSKSNYVTGPGQGRSIMNDFVVFLLPGEATDGSFSLVEHHLQPGRLGAPVHTHRREDEYSYVLEGELTVMIGDEVFTLPPGGFVRKPRDVPHTFWNQGTRPTKILEIISPAGFEKYFDELAGIVSAPGGPNADRLLAARTAVGLEMDLSSVPVLKQKYGVSIPSPKPAPVGQPL